MLSTHTFVLINDLGYDGDDAAGPLCHFQDVGDRT